MAFRNISWTINSYFPIFQSMYEKNIHPYTLTSALLFLRFLGPLCRVRFFFIKCMINFPLSIAHTNGISDDIFDIKYYTKKYGSVALVQIFRSYIFKRWLKPLVCQKAWGEITETGGVLLHLFLRFCQLGSTFLICII